MLSEDPNMMIGVLLYLVIVLFVGAVGNYVMYYPLHDSLSIGRIGHIV